MKMKYEDLWSLQSGWRCCICGKTDGNGWTMIDVHWVHLKCGNITNSYTDDLQVYRKTSEPSEKKKKYNCWICKTDYAQKRERDKCKHENKLI